MKLKRKLSFIFSLFFVLLLLICPVLAQDQTENFPASYDLRNVNGKNYVTSVKLQNPFGTCWAHAAISCCETNAMLNGYSGSPDFSEKSLAWFNFQFQGPIEAQDDELEGVYNNSFHQFIPQGFELETNVYNSGSSYMGTAPSQLSTWLGTSTEEQIPYTNANGDLIEVDGQQIEASELGDWTLDYYDIYNNAFHLQNSEIIYGPKSGETVVEEYVPKVKDLMLENGSVCLGYSAIADSTSPKPNNYFNDQTSAQYIPAGEKEDPNHAVTVVGWDDNYPKENFVITPPGNGAWIIKNSWGTSWGDNGYFYLSYYDSSIFQVSSFDIETAEMNYSYDHNYQYDYTGDKFNFTREIGVDFLNNQLSDGTQITPDLNSFANVFTAKGNELLKAVSAYTILPDSQVSAKIYLLNDGYTSPVDGQLVGEVSKSFDNRGFYTLDLDEPIALQAGQKFSVVENIIYTVRNKEDNSITYNVPMFSLKYGLEDLYLSDLIDEMGQVTGSTLLNITAKVNEGESYIYGFTSNGWSDVTNPETYDQLILTEGDQDEQLTYLPGNCMIKAYTSENQTGAILPTGVQFNNSGIIYLTAGGVGQNTAQVTASVLPADATISNVTYSVYPSTVASVTQNGNTAQVTAVSEGHAKLIARTVNGYVATKDIIVSDKSFIVGNVLADTTHQDYLQLEIQDLYANPALDLNETPNSVSVFVWSSDSMSDVQAVPATRVPNSDNWITSEIGINNTEKYLINGDQIRYIVYIADSNGSTNMVFSGLTRWVEPGTEEQGNVSYIAYNQNIGFVQPTVHSDSSGMIDNPDSVHMEGLRISSGIPGVNVITSIHAANLGWIEGIGDGVYAGTMHENRALEAIALNLDTTLDNYHIYYRVYIKGQGWSNWASDGQVAGTVGYGIPIQSFEVLIVEINNGLTINKV